MKKVLAILFITAACYTLSAQSDAGLYLGANFAGVNMQTPELSTETRTGFQGGVFYRKGDFIYGQAGLEYQLFRVHLLDQSSIDGVREDDINIQKFDLPLYIGLNLLPLTDDLANVRLYAGPTFGYISNVPVNELELTTSDLGKIRIDGSVGAGLDIMLFNLDVGYSFGVNELFTDEFSGRSHYAFVNAGISF